MDISGALGDDVLVGTSDDDKINSGEGDDTNTGGTIKMIKYCA